MNYLTTINSRFFYVEFAYSGTQMSMLLEYKNVFFKNTDI